MPDLDIYSLLKTELMVGIPDGLADKLGDMQKAEDGLCILDEPAIDIIKNWKRSLESLCSQSREAVLCPRRREA